MFDRLIESFRLFSKAVLDFAHNFFNAISEILLPAFDDCKRITHLAFHAKKARVRKKNARRLFDKIFYEVKKYEYNNGMV